MATIIKNYLIVSILVAILQNTSATLTNNGQNFESSNTVKPAREADYGELPSESRQNFADRPVSAQKEGKVSSYPNDNSQLKPEYADNFSPESNQLPAMNNLDSNVHNSAKSAQEIEDEVVLSRLDLAHLSKIRMETKQLPLERKCTIYDKELRKMLAEEGTLNSRALLSQVIRVLSQRKLPFGNSQPALSDLRMCLENSPNDKAENSTGSGSVKREVIAGPNSNKNLEVKKVSGENHLRDAIDEFKEVKNNVKDFGQDIYLPKNKNLPEQKVVDANRKVEAYENRLKTPTENVFVGQKQSIQDETYNSHNDYDNNRLPQINKLRKVDANYNAQPSDKELHLNPSFVSKEKVEREVKDGNEVLNRIDIDRLIQVALYSKELKLEKKCEILSDELRGMTGLTSSQQELFTLVASLMSKSISPEALPVLTAVNVCLKSSLNNEKKDTKRYQQFANQELSEPNSNEKHDRQPVYFSEPLNERNRGADVVVEDVHDDDDDDPPYMRVYNGNPNTVEQNYHYDEDHAQSVESEVDKHYNEDFIQPSDDLFEGHNVFGLDNSYEEDRSVNLVTPSQDLLAEKELEIRDLRSQIAQLRDLVEQSKEDSLRSKEKLNKVSADILRTNNDNTSQRELALLKQLDELKAKLILQDGVIKRNFERLDEEDEHNGEGLKGKDKEKEKKKGKDKDKDSKKEIKDIVESTIELKSKIDDDESLYDRCYRYYLLFNYPKKVNKYVIKTIANLDINLANRETLLELTGPLATDSLLENARILTQTSKKKAIEVGNELYSCFETRKYGQPFERPVMNNQFSNKGHSFFDTHYSENSSREGSKRVSIPIHRVHRAFPPIPPMPPMMSVSQRFNRFR